MVIKFHFDGMQIANRRNCVLWGVLVAKPMQVLTTHTKVKEFIPKMINYAL